MNSSVELQRYKKLVMIAGGASVATAILFIIIKFVVWVISSSTVIFASLTDSIFDLLASLVNLLALKFSLSPPDKEHRYGHHKSQALASLAQAAFIGGSSVLLVIHGIERCLHPQGVLYLDLAIIVSVISIVITVLLVLLQTYVYRLTRSEAISADRLHYLSDVTLNIGVLLALALSYYGYLWADGLFASLIGLFIMKGAYVIGFRAVQTLLDKSLGRDSIKKIINAIHSIGDVKSVHDLKTHRAGPMVYIQGHLVLDGNMDLFKAHDIVDEIEKKIRIDFPDAEIILHMEPDTQSTYEDVVFFDSAEDKTE
ncbi:MAG: cation diffusion facilitator family transporter [Succinivibrio sp.]|uniref:Cation diffusion facilitator family transporter n=1 Tax=Succinivibrio faecicola TaxID=2820300 RepID=A0ABS7DHS4_9GAMM|nr:MULTISPECIES: cation diffusion facilitator family transporter [Succinivibrio]MBW7570849.1 cation diffusion facilitator family transporter [Succinivibrio faecicola]MCI6939571.1 cation diffusion facilitator family transporter [Succinatimonas hippei]MDD6205345.1 cation diffusion facilitator family transporter [Succinivibrio sp.]